jgi:hypothetical protein
MVALQAPLNVPPPPAAPSRKGESRASGAAAVTTEKGLTFSASTCPFRRKRM